MLVLASLAACLGGTATPAYPIPPRPLRLLIQESEFIVTARVVAADRRTSELELDARRRQSGAGGVMLLEIDGFVKGDPGRTTIAQVNYGWICPAPARYVAGTRVLAFLDREADGEGFTTHALSYGAKTLDDAGMALYLERIREQLAIERLPEGEPKLATQVEWLVKCAEDPLTRWEGAYELARAGDFMSFYEHRSSRSPDFAGQLSYAQRERLREAFLQARSFESGEQCLEVLFHDDPDPRLQAWLVAELREHHQEVEKNGYGVSAVLVERIARRDGRPEVRELATAFRDRQTYGKCGDDGEGRLEFVRALLAFF